MEAIGVAVPEVGAELTADRLPGGSGECMPVLVFLVAIYIPQHAESSISRHFQDRPLTWK